VSVSVSPPLRVAHPSRFPPRAGISLAIANGEGPGRGGGGCVGSGTAKKNPPCVSSCRPLFDAGRGEACGAIFGRCFAITAGESNGWAGSLESLLFFPLLAFSQRVPRSPSFAEKQELSGELTLFHAVLLRSSVALFKLP